MERNKADMERWKSEMQIYEKSKRTKNPFGKDFTPAP